DHEQIAEAVIEDDLGGDARIRAAEDDRERLLPVGELVASRFADARFAERVGADESAVAVLKAFECFSSRDHVNVDPVAATPASPSREEAKQASQLQSNGTRPALRMLESNSRIFRQLRRHRGLGMQAAQSIPELAVLKDQHGGNSADVESSCGLSILIDVELGDNPSPVAFGGELVDRRAEHSARRAPLCPAVDE